MTETPRQYKKRIDDKWKKNEKNRDELIQQIEKYELVDKRFKTRTKQEILENFEKNKKAEKESEQYRIIVSELENIDKKYGELGKLKEKLKAKKQEKAQVDKEIRESKLDGSDETTLKMQMASVRKLTERLEILKTEIEELEKDVENREQELKEIEETYGDKTMSSWTEGEESNTWKVEDSSLSSEWQDVAQWKPSTLKEYHEQTVQDLWNKDRTRWKIFEILEEWTWIDAELKGKIEKEISDRFFDYYDEKQWSLRMKSARFVKNKLRNKEKCIESIKNMPKWEKKEGKITELERLEKAYFWKESDLRRIAKLSEFAEERGLKLVEHRKVLNIWWKPVFMVKDSDWYFRVYRWDKECYWSFQGKKDKYKKINDIHELNWRPIFLALDSDWYYSIIVWYERYTWDYKKWYYKAWEIIEDLEEKNYRRGEYKIIWWEK